MRCHLSSTLMSQRPAEQTQGWGGWWLWHCGLVWPCGRAADTAITPLWSCPPVLSTCPTGILSQVPAGMLLKMVLLVQSVRERVEAWHPSCESGWVKHGH